MVFTVSEKGLELRKAVEEISGQNIFQCYQCGKCSATCPVVDSMDMAPNKIIRFVQMGDLEVLDQNTFWVCAACFTCSARCPRSVDIAKIMEALRNVMLRNKQDFINIYSKEFIEKMIEEIPQMAIVAAIKKGVW